MAITRRDALKKGLLGAVGLAAGVWGQPRPGHAALRRRTILLRSSWQTVNIGDIGHTPGLLALLEKRLPEADVILWPAAIDRGVEPMLRRRFPRVEIVQGRTDAEGRPASAELTDAFARADLMLHGSGPSVVGAKQLTAWRRHTGKPYGVFGVTVETIGPELTELLNGAAFVFTRETRSLANLAKAGVTRPICGFAPDATFAIDLRDDSRAEAYMKANALEPKKFLCAVPRLRYTPYHLHGKVPWSAAETRRRMEVNDRYAEVDHAKLREAIVAWVRGTGLPAVVCPEMTYQLDIIGPLVVDRLPADVKQRVVARTTYWLPDEAGSLYRQARAVVSFECHSPIIALAQGTPAIYLRQPTDTIKGQMYRDIGAWTFEIDETPGAEIGRALTAIHADYPAAQAKLGRAMEVVGQKYVAAIEAVRRTLFT